MGNDEKGFWEMREDGDPLAGIDPSWYPLILREIWNAYPEAFQVALSAALLENTQRLLEKKKENDG